MSNYEIKPIGAKLLIVRHDDGQVAPTILLEGGARAARRFIADENLPLDGDDVSFAVARGRELQAKAYAE